MKFEYINTPRLTLRKLNAEVYKYVFQKYSVEEIKKFFGHQNEGEYLRDQRMFENGITTFNKDLLMFHLIEHESNLVIGWCGYHTWYTDHDRAEIGCGFTDHNFTNKGLMLEALQTVISYGFDQMNLHRIEALISPENIRSINLIEKVNFKREGLLKEHYLKNGVYEDSEVFRLLHSEYAKEES